MSPFKIAMGEFTPPDPITGDEGMANVDTFRLHHSSRCGGQPRRGGGQDRMSWCLRTSKRPDHVLIGALG